MNTVTFHHMIQAEIDKLDALHNSTDELCDELHDLLEEMETVDQRTDSEQ